MPLKDDGTGSSNSSLSCSPLRNLVILCSFRISWSVIPLSEILSKKSIALLFAAKYEFFIKFVIQKSGLELVASFLNLKKNCFQKLLLSFLNH